MKTLVEHYEKRKNELRTGLDEAKSPEQIVQIIQNEMRGLADLTGEYISDLTAPQARIALEMLESRRQSFGLLTAIRTQKSTPVQYAADGSPLKGSSEATVLVISGMAGVGALVGWLAGPVGSGLGAAFASALGTQLVPQPSKQTDQAVYPVRFEQIKLKVDSDVLLSHLYQAFEAIDQAVAEADQPKETTPKPTLEDLPDLMEFLQNLMGDAHDEQEKLPKFTRQRIKELPPILRHHGIETKVYQAGEKQTSGMDAFTMFEFEPSLDPEIKEYVTLKPAFIKDGQVLLQGRVIEPAS